MPIITRFGGGGGGLNFKVNAYTELPASGKENEIAVITSTPMAGWVMQAEQPTGAEGLVWIELSDMSKVAFSVSKKQTVMIYPLAVHQYVSGAFRDVEAKVYQAGEWYDVNSTLTVFDGGDNTSITGGWSAYGKPDAFTVDTQIYLKSKAGEGVFTYASTHNPIDLTRYSTILVNCTSITDVDGRIKVYVSSTIGTTMAAKVSLTGIGQHSINVKSLNGLYYIGLYTQGNAGFHVNKIEITE